MSAGLAIALAAGRSFADALAMGAAAGTANAGSLGAGRLEAADVERVLGEVRLRTAPDSR